MSSNETSSLLLVLQHADSFFPSGATAFSWGLETLHAEGHVGGAEQLEALLSGQLAHRWATCDRPALELTYAAAENMEIVAALDEELETLSLARELREGSRRAGGTLLRVHEQLHNPLAATYRGLIKAGKGHGHLPCMQAMLWRATGMGLPAVLAASAHGLCLGMLGAAIRLGIIGHLECQRMLRRAHAVIGQLLAAPAGEVLSSFVPGAEIAMMRHETGRSRLFAN
jgi:urease accessory protein